MIRQADDTELSVLPPVTEAAVRIRSLWEFYGAGRPFCRFWRWGENGRISLMEGTAVLYTGGETGEEELAAFLTMSPDIERVRTDGATARRLAERIGCTAETGAVMSPSGPPVESPVTCVDLPPRDLYPLLVSCFASGIPPFDVWYADVSHRQRHGLCRIAAVLEDGVPVAGAMTVAECGGGALIGAVATRRESRGRGYASACVSRLTRALMKEGRQVYLSPKNETARRIYSRLGFIETGEWGAFSLR